MSGIPERVQDFIVGKLAWVATASLEGEPNVTPKGSLKLLDEQHVAFAELFPRKTAQNLLVNRKVAVTVVDAAAGTGYQLKGTAELLESGPLFDDICRHISGLEGLPAPRYAVKIAVEAVFDQAGIEPGKQIA